MLQTLMLYFLASILLFFIQSYLTKIIKVNFYHSIIITQIYLLFLSGIFTTYHITPNNNSIFLIVLFTFFIQIFYLYDIEETSFQSSTNILKKEIINLGIAYLLNVFFINKVENVFLTTDEFKILIWIIIVIYLYTNIKKLSTLDRQKHYLLSNKEGEYIVVEYAKLKNKYNSIIHTKYKELIPLIYAMMIYENYKRPLFLRKLDIILYKLDKERRCFGIMQIPSNYPINDEKSILLAIKKLERIYSKITNEKDNISETIKKYYPKNTPNEVMIIYKKIKSFS